MNQSLFEVLVPAEDFGPGYATWEASTKTMFLERRLFHLRRQLSMQEGLAENQRHLFKAIHKEYEDTLAQLQEKNRELKRLGRELLAVKNGLEREVRKRTKALEKKNVSLEEYATQLEQANIALDVLLMKHEKDRGAVAHKIFEQWRADILPNLEQLRQLSPHEDQQTLIDLVLTKFQAGDPNCVNRESHWCTCLSEREAAVARLIAEGKGCREVAQVLLISLRCVHSHCYNIRKKLGLTRKTRLKAYLMQTA